MLGIPWRTDQAPDHVAVPETEPADLGSGHVHVMIAWKQPLRPQETVPFLENFEGSAAEPVIQLLGLGFEDGYDEVVLAERGKTCKAELFRNFAKLGIEEGGKLPEGVPRFGRGLERRFAFRILSGGDRRKVLFDRLRFLPVQFVFEYGVGHDRNYRFPGPGGLWNTAREMERIDNTKKSIPFLKPPFRIPAPGPE